MRHPAEQGQKRKEFEDVSQNPSKKSLIGLKIGRDTGTLLEKRRKGLRSWMALDGRGKSLKEIRIEKNEKSDEIIQNQYLKVKDN